MCGGEYEVFRDDGAAAVLGVAVVSAGGAAAGGASLLNGEGFLVL